MWVLGALPYMAALLWQAARLADDLPETVEPAR